MQAMSLTKEWMYGFAIGPIGKEAKDKGTQKTSAPMEKGEAMSEYILRETAYPGAVKQEVVGEIVRCGDCKYIGSPLSPTADYHTCKHQRAMIDAPVDGFCCWGERRTDEK